MKNYQKTCKSILNNKRFRSIVLSFIFILSTALLITGCSSSSKTDTYKTQSTTVPEEFNYTAPAQESFDGTADVAGKSPTEGTVSEEKTTTDRKLIKNGSIEIACEDVEVSYQNVTGLVDKYQGFNTNLNRSEADKMLSIYAEFGIPADKLDQFIAEINETEIVNYVKITADDITDAYYDATIRLETSEKSLEKYYEFLADAKKIEDMIHIQGEIDRLTQDIELLKGSLKRWDSQVDYSYVSIEFRQKEAPISGKREIEFKSMSWDDFKYLVNSGWNSMFSAIVSMLQWLAIVLLITAPVIVVTVLIVILIVFLVKKRKKSLLKKQQEQGIIQNEGNVDSDSMTYTTDQTVDQPMDQNNQQQGE